MDNWQYGYQEDIPICDIQNFHSLVISVTVSIWRRLLSRGYSNLWSYQYQSHMEKNSYFFYKSFHVRYHYKTWYDSNNMIEIWYEHVMDSTRVEIWLDTF